MLVNFAKMHGLGNDFVIIDLITQQAKLHTAHIIRIADRRFGIGCDQVLLLEPPLQPDRDFYYRIFNADGFEVEQCGNGARCAARFFYDSGYVLHTQLKADCLAGPIEFQMEAQDNVTVTMGKPIIQDQTVFHYQTNSISFIPVSMGNPHAVVRVNSFEEIELKELGSAMNADPHFPQGVNVELMYILDPNHIELRVFERGIGESLACGSGACAAVVAGIKAGWLQSPVTVTFQDPSLGVLTIQWAGDSKPVYMTGPTVSVFVGRFRL